MAHTAAERPPEETLSLWKGEQARLKARVVDRDTEAWQRDPSFSGLQKVGGVDVSFVKGDSVRACASLRSLSWWSWYSGCKRRNQISCPRSFLWMETGCFTNEASGWPATLVSLQSCHASGWPRSSCRWMDWRTMLCTRRRLCSCRPEETHFL
uniref:Endonuclease V n=1 Tax=Mus musculus TaxID=10090 RepID=E9PXN2_MOUSE